MRTFRSLLYVYTDQPKLMEDAPSSGADALVLDLEDHVPMARKAEARSISREYIEKHKRNHVMYVRVNGLDSGLLRDDLEAIVLDGLEGITIPKVDSPETVKAVDALLTEVETARGLPPGGLQISVGLESARGVYYTYEICSASSRVSSVAAGTGTNGDLQTDMGYLSSKEGTEILYLRSKVLLAARAAGVQHPLDGAFGSTKDGSNRDVAGLIRSAEMGRQLGYRGKKCNHISQVEHVNRIFSPTPREIEYYHRVLDAFETALAAGSASTSVDGKLIDYTMAANARRVLAWAKEIEGKG